MFDIIMFFLGPISLCFLGFVLLYVLVILSSNSDIHYVSQILNSIIDPRLTEQFYMKQEKKVIVQTKDEKIRMFIKKKETTIQCSLFKKSSHPNVNRQYEFNPSNLKDIQMLDYELITSFSISEKGNVFYIKKFGVQVRLEGQKRKFENLIKSFEDFVKNTAINNNIFSINKIQMLNSDEVEIKDYINEINDNVAWFKNNEYYYSNELEKAHKIVTLKDNALGIIDTYHALKSETKKERKEEVLNSLKEINEKIKVLTNSAEEVLLKKLDRDVNLAKIRTHE